MGYKIMPIFIENPNQIPVNFLIIPTPTEVPQKQCDYSIPPSENFEFTWTGLEQSTISEDYSFEKNIAIASQDVINTLAQNNPALANILENKNTNTIPYWVTYRFMTEFIYSDINKERSMENIQNDIDLLKNLDQFMVVLSKTVQMSYFSAINDENGCTTPIRQILLELLYSGSLTPEEKDSIIFMLTDGFNEYSKGKDFNDECLFDYNGFIYFINEQRFEYTYKPPTNKKGENIEINDPCKPRTQKGKTLKLENKEVGRQERLANINRPLNIRNYKNR